MGHLDALSRQATQNAMGPWFILDPVTPNKPGCSFETVRQMVRRNKITPNTIVRSPTTRQVWTYADHTPGLAVLLGVCHSCKARVQADAASCGSCGAPLQHTDPDRQHLGLSPVAQLPGTPTVDAPAPPRPPQPLEEEVLAHAPARSVADDRVRVLRARTRLLTILLVATALLAVGAGGWAVWRELEAGGFQLDVPGANTAQGTQQRPPAAGPTQTSATTSPTTPPPAGPSPGPANGAGPPPTGPAERLPEVVIDPVTGPLGEAFAEWHPDLRQARDLAADDTLEGVREALAVLERVAQEAGADVDEGEAGWAVLRQRITRLRERADALYAEGLVGR